MRMLAAAAVLFVSLSAVHAADVELRLDRLAPSLKLLNDQDRRIVDQAIQLIQRGEGKLALAQLSALSKSNPKNSSVRILAAYVMLEAGNLLGAFEHAKKAESSEPNSYLCWFLAKVALLTGNRDACQREVKHLKKVGDMPAETEALEKQMKEISRR
jgi:predicted Zn-dependent protease